MPPSGGPEPPESELAELAARRDALQQAAGLPGAQIQPLLDAAFAELDGAIDALTALQAQTTARKADAPSEQTRAERRMLRAVFQEAPVPLFLLERDGTVRRVNNRASDIIGSRPAYAAGKPFTVFVDLPSRAAVQTYLVAAARTGRARQTEAGLLSEAGVVRSGSRSSRSPCPRTPASCWSRPATTSRCSGGAPGPRRRPGRRRTCRRPDHPGHRDAAAPQRPLQHQEPRHPRPSPATQKPHQPRQTAKPRSPATSQA